MALPLMFLCAVKKVLTHSLVKWGTNCNDDVITINLQCDILIISSVVWIIEVDRMRPDGFRPKPKPNV